MEIPVLVVHICTILLGTNSLISTSGLWVEVPLMLPRLPEGWKLPSYLNVIVQLANIGPILYGIFHFLFPRRITERGVCFGMLFIGSMASILMAQFWDKTIIIFGAIRSVWLFVLTFCLALVDSLSSVVCLPFMAILKPKYITSYMIGEGFSGLVPSIFSIIQSVNENQVINCSGESLENSSFIENSTDIDIDPISAVEQPLIAIETFFYMLFVMMVISTIGFIVLNFHPIVKSEYDAANNFQDCNSSTENIEIFNIQVPSIGTAGYSTKDMDKNDDTSCPSPTKTTYFLVFLSQVYISGLQYGVMNTLQPYSCLPYGNLPYHLATVLSCLACPVMAVTYVIFPTMNKRLLYAFTFLGTIISGYLLTTAVKSPNPPLKEFLVGKILVVTGWILFSCLLSYVKVAVACLQRDISHLALFWGGVGIQVGGSLGALVTFLLVAVFKVFHEEGCT